VTESQQSGVFPDVLMQIKVVPLSLTKVKKRGCVRKQMAEKFGASRFLPYLCIVNQKELVTQKKKKVLTKRKKKG